VLGEGDWLILGENNDIKNPGIDTVTQGKVYDAILAGKGNRRFSALLR